MPEFIDFTFYGNPGQRWTIAALVAVVTYVVLRLLVTVVARRLGRLARRTKTTWDDLIVEMLRKTKFLFLLVLALHAGSLGLVLPERLRAGIEIVTILVLLIQSGIWVNAAITFWFTGYHKRALEGDAARATTVAAITFVARLATWSIILLLGLENLGVDVTALVAGLGVGGIAVALAVQNILGDLFASLSIMLDKPFRIGDFLIVGDLLGSVEMIGLKTTRLRSLSGEQLVFSNTDLLTSRIRNYGRMYERRISFSIGVTYQTQREKLRMIPAIIREATEAQTQTRFDRSHFKSYGDFALIFETVYYVLVPDYNVYMDVQEAINYRIHERFEAEGIEFAYPTQTLFLSKSDS